MSERSASEHSKVDSGVEKKDDKDWIVKGGKKFLVVLEKKNRMDAIKCCVKEGGKLAEPKSAQAYFKTREVAKKLGKSESLLPSLLNISITKLFNATTTHINIGIFT